MKRNRFSLLWFKQGVKRFPARVRLSDLVRAALAFRWAKPRKYRDAA
jgi:hypothetical protein